MRSGRKGYFQFWKEVIYSVGFKEKKIPGKYKIKTCFFFYYLYFKYVSFLEKHQDWEGTAMNCTTSPCIHAPKNGYAMTRENSVCNQRQNPDVQRENDCTAVTLKMTRGLVFFFNRNNGHQDFSCNNQRLNA